MKELCISSPRLSWSSEVREKEEAKRVHQNTGSRDWIGVKVAIILGSWKERVEQMSEAKSLDPWA
jgi:hypothetical protein